MRKLEDVFDAWAEGGSDGGRGPGEVEVRDLKECFTELGREVEPIALRAWCEEADLAPGDALSLADFAYAFHAMFVDAGGEGVCVSVYLVKIGKERKRCPFCHASAIDGPAVRESRSFTIIASGIQQSERLPHTSKQFFV